MPESNFTSKVSGLAQKIFQSVRTIINEWVFKLLLANKNIKFSFGQVISIAFWLILFALTFFIQPSREMFTEYFVAYHFPNLTYICLFVLNLGLYIVPYDFLFRTKTNEDYINGDWLKKYYWSNAFLLFVPLHLYLIGIYVYIFNIGENSYIDVFSWKDIGFWIFAGLILLNLILSAKIFSKDLTTYKTKDLLHRLPVFGKFNESDNPEVIPNTLSVERTTTVDNGKSSFPVFWVPFFITLLGVFYYKYFVNDLSQNWGASINVLTIMILILCAYRYILYVIFVVLRAGIIFLLNYFKFNEEAIPILNKKQFSGILIGMLLIAFLWYANKNKFYRIEDKVQLNIFNSDNTIDTASVVYFASRLKEKKLSVEEYFKYWVNSITSDSSQIYLVAAAGGGSRAGLWTFQVLKELKKTIPNFHQDLFAVSSVSGGSVGASLYLNSIGRIGSDKQNLACIDNLDSASIEFFTSDFVTKPLLYYLGVEPINVLFNSVNRNDILLEGMNEKFTEYFLRNSFRDCGDDNKPKGYNALFPRFTKSDTLGDNKSSTVFIANTFDINESKPAITSSVDLGLDRYIIDIDHITNFPIQNDQAVNFSEMFPFLSASASIMGNDGELHHFYDGGVYDNYGISSILPLYRKIREIRNEIADHKRIVLILIDNSPDSNNDGDLVINNSFKSLYKAVSNSTFKSVPNSYRQIITDELNDIDNRDTIIELELDKKVTLNRWLSESTAQSIKTTAKTLVQSHKLEFSRPRNLVKGVLLEDKGGCVVQFNAGKSELFSNYIEIVDAAYNNFWKNSTDSIYIKGYADSSGSIDMNEELVSNRAIEVYSYLLKKYPILESRLVRVKGKIVDPKNDTERRSDYWKVSMRKAEIFLR